MNRRFTPFRESLREACLEVYGGRLVSLAVFGSWARSAATPVSDVDVLVVAQPLPPSRRKRVAEFERVEALTAPAQRAIWEDRQAPSDLSPVIKTPDEARAGSPLFLDMTHACDIILDRDRFLSAYLDALKRRLEELGARRLFRKGGYCWQYKPGLRPQEALAL